MAKKRCDVNEALAMLSVSKIPSSTEIYFSVVQDNDSCVKIVTKDYVDIHGDSATYNKFNRPKDAFNCLAEGCRNSGELVIVGEQNELGATFEKMTNANELYAGASTFYVNLPEDGNYVIEYTISDAKDKTPANADVYRQTINGKQGYNPVFIDFSRVPEEVIGEGWQASTQGIRITILVSQLDSEGELIPIEQVGISSISFYDSVYELNNDSLVALGCVSENGGDMTMDVSDSVCFGSTYDPTSAEITRTLTAGKVSGNYWLLNPFMRAGEATEGWVVSTSKEVVQEVIIDGQRYGYVYLEGLATEECSFTSAIIADECAQEAELSKVNIPGVTDLEDNQYQIIKEGEYAGYLLVNERLIGEAIVFAYPMRANIEQFIADDTAYEGRRVRMYFTTKLSDGTEVTYIFNNVLITSFPSTFSSTDETTFEFEISIQKDANGHFFTMNRVVTG